jgi:hypothetical protein
MPLRTDANAIRNLLNMNASRVFQIVPIVRAHRMHAAAGSGSRTAGMRSNKTRIETTLPAHP